MRLTVLSPTSLEGLPVYTNPDQILGGSMNHHKLIHQSGDTIIRRLRLRTKEAEIDSLHDVLEIADSLFEEAASFAGATVVNHQWGLAPRPPGCFIHNDERRVLPKGYCLAAEIERLTDTYHPNNDQIKLLDRLEGMQDRTSVYWDDYHPFQFTNGTGHAGPDTQLYLHDIEPILDIDR
jgi:hypothetical protein